MEPLVKLGRIIMLIGGIIAAVAGAAIGLTIQYLVAKSESSQMFYILNLVSDILIMGIAVLVVIAGDIVEDEERSVIPDKIGLPISLIGGVLAAIGGIGIAKAFTIDPIPILNVVLGALFCVMGAVVAYSGKFISDL